MTTVQMLNLILVIIIFLIFILSMIAILIILKMRRKKEEATIQTNNINVQPKNTTTLITRDGKNIDSIYKFMEFDSITNNMIVRKNRTQYVMVIECKGINYDLLSSEEKDAVENGFTEFLNMLRFPIQLYIQTRKLDFKNLLNEYNKRTDELADQIKRINAQIQLAKNKGDQNLINKLEFDKRRKQNIIEYGESIEDYTARINESANMLQQRMFLVFSYYTSEIGDTSKYSKEEIDDIVFSELYTRAQTLIRALSSAEVVGKALSSEELTELLYIAYNRDESETYSLRDALNIEYDRLYSTAKDVLEERKKRIQSQVADEASKLASKSILKADEIIRKEQAKEAQQVKEQAVEMINEYKGSMSDKLYNETVSQIRNTNNDEILSETKKRNIKKEI